MKKLNRVFAFVLTLAMLLCSTGFAPGAAAAETKFPDVGTDYWAYQLIDKYVAKGVITGMPDGNFGPELPLSRAAFIQMLVKDSAAYQFDRANQNKDLYKSWWMPAYLAAVNSDLIEKGQFPVTDEAMNAGITRNEMARMLVRADEHIKRRPAVAADTAGIKDFAEIPAEFADSVGQAYTKGILKGYADGTFGGEKTLMRCEAVAALDGLNRTVAPVPTPAPTPVPTEKPLVPEGMPKELEGNENVRAFVFKDKATGELIKGLPVWFGSDGDAYWGGKPYMLGTANYRDYSGNHADRTGRAISNSDGVVYVDATLAYRHITEPVEGQTYRPPVELPVELTEVNGAKATSSLGHNFGRPEQVAANGKYYVFAEHDANTEANLIYDKSWDAPRPISGPGSDRPQRHTASRSYTAADLRAATEPIVVYMNEVPEPMCTWTADISVSVGPHPGRDEVKGIDVTGIIAEVWTYDATKKPSEYTPVKLAAGPIAIPERFLERGWTAEGDISLDVTTSYEDFLAAQKTGMKTGFQVKLSGDNEWLKTRSIPDLLLLDRWEHVRGVAYASYCARDDFLDGDDYEPWHPAVGYEPVR